jgi:uncharacterized protein
MILGKATGFDWDDANAQKIRTRHGVEPFECEEAFFNPMLLVSDEHHSGEEPRFHALGSSDEGRELFLAFTMRANKIRIISARDMSKKERKRYHEKIEENSPV